MTDRPDFSNPPPGQMGVRIQLTSDRKKAKRQYEDLMRGGQFDKAVIIAELTRDRGYHVLSQGMTLEDIPKALFATVTVLQETAKNQAIPQAGMNFGVSAGIELARAGPARPDRAITKDPDGTLHPPPGEAFTTCGECQSSSWYITGAVDAEVPARFACTNCGNEVLLRRLPATQTTKRPQ